MRAKTLWQPPASLVACGAKTSETRSQPPPRALIGDRFAIHAAKRPVDWFDDVQPIIDHSPEARDAINAALKFGRDAALRCGLGALGSNDWPLGCVVATCRLVDAFQVSSSANVYTGSATVRLVDADTHARVCTDGQVDAWVAGTGIAPGNASHTVRDDGLGDYSVGRWVWLLEEIEPLAEPVPARGWQGIWNWEPPEDWPLSAKEVS